MRCITAILIPAITVGWNGAYASSLGKRSRGETDSDFQDVNERWRGAPHPSLVDSSRRFESPWIGSAISRRNPSPQLWTPRILMLHFLSFKPAANLYEIDIHLRQGGFSLAGEELRALHENLLGYTRIQNWLHRLLWIMGDMNFPVSRIRTIAPIHSNLTPSDFDLNRRVSIWRKYCIAPLKRPEAGPAPPCAPIFEPHRGIDEQDWILNPSSYAALFRDMYFEESLATVE
jgi:hypothetical protein